MTEKKVKQKKVFNVTTLPKLPAPGWQVRLAGEVSERPTPEGCSLEMHRHFSDTGISMMLLN